MEIDVPEGFPAISDRYLPLVQLGESEYAVTYLARHASDGRHVVVRMPVDALVAQSSFAYQFERAALELTRVKHPHIVRVLDAGRADGVPYAVTEYIQGESLAQRLGGDLATQSPTQVYDWLLDVAEALDFIHAKKIVHSEIRPGHILLERADLVRITDFVFAAAIRKLDKKVQAEFAPRRSGTAAPELALGGTPTPATDQYALAAVAYLALVGEYPTAERPDLEAALLERVTPEAAEDILRGLASKPENRFASCYEFARAFGLERKRHRDDRELDVLEMGVPLPFVPPPERDTVDAEARGGVGEEGPSPLIDPFPPSSRGKAVPPPVPTLEAANFGRSWWIRLGPNDRYARLARDQGFVAAAWGELGDVAELAQDEAGLANLVTRFEQTYGVSGIQARTGAGQVWRFVAEMEPSDLVLVPNPEEGLLHVGRIEGSSVFDPVPSDGCRLPRRREVLWLRDVPLDEVPNALLRRLGGASQIVNLDSHRRHVRELVIQGGTDAATSGLLDAMVKSLYARSVDDFAAFLRDLFAALRFDAEILPGRSDETWEAAGPISARGLADVPLHVWASRARRDLDVDSVYETRGSLAAEEQGALISLGGFTSRARTEASAPGRKAIRLVDGRTLVAIALEHWADLSDRARDALGVDRIERATIEVEFRARPREAPS